MGGLVEKFQSLPNTALVLVFLAVGLFFFIKLLRAGLRMATGKEITVKAKVIDKYQTREMWGIHQRERIPGYERPKWEIAFHTGGTVVRLPVAEFQYNSIQVGQEGHLTYQGKAFIRFDVR